jgi:hypothetical protein
VPDPTWTFIMTAQFTCTGPEIAAGQVYWLRPTAPPGSIVIGRLRQAVVTAG